MFFALLVARRPRRAHNVSNVFTWIQAGTLHGRHRLPRRPAVGHDDPARHRRRLADPPVLDRLHARRRAVQPLLRLPEPVRRRRCSCSCSARASCSPSSAGRASASARTCSISFWFERNSAAVAGKKAFVTNRVGDFGFMLAMFLIFATLGTLDYAAMDAGAGAHLADARPPRSRCCCFVGAIGKSAQIPLHIWLPDAMEGPTPVSALIHAATMVTAGVFLVVPGAPVLRRVRARGDGRRVGRRDHRAARGTVAHRAARHQARARVLHDQPARLHVPRGRRRRVHAPRCSMMIMPRVLQGAAVPRCRLGDPRHRTTTRTCAAWARLRKFMPITAGDVHRRLAGDRRRSSRSRASGRRTRSSPGVVRRDDYALWVVGVVAALLTAFYMTRQVCSSSTATSAGTTAARWPGEPAVRGRAAARRDAHDAPSSSRPRRRRRSRRRPARRARADAARVAVDHDVAARRARRASSIVGGLINLPFTNRSSTSSTSWLEPVFDGVARAARRARSRSAFALVDDRARRRDRRHRASAARSTATGSPRTGDDPVGRAARAVRQGARQRVLLRRGHRPLRRRPAHRARRASSATTSTTRSSTARSTASRAASARPAAGCASCRPASCATTRSAIVSARSLLVGYMLDPGRWRDVRLPDPHRRSSSLPAVGALLTLLMPSSRPELARGRRLRHERRRRSASPSTCCATSTAPTRASSSSSSHALDGAARRALDSSASTASACSWSRSPRCCSRSACSRRPSIERAEGVHRRGCCCSRRRSSASSSRSTSSLFFVFFEVVLVPMYFLIAGWGHEQPRATRRRSSSSTRWPARRSCSSAILARRRSCTSSADGRPHVRLRRSLTDWASAAARCRRRRPSGCSSAFAVAFAVKVPLFPFHTWLPDAHTEAPTAGSVVLAGVILKMGTYGFLRFAFPMFPQAAVDLAPLLLVLAVIGIIYGAIVAAMQTEPETAHRVLVGRAPGLRRARHLRAHAAGHPGRRCSRCCRTRSPPARCSSSSACSTSAGTRTRSRDYSGLWKAIPVFGGLFVIAAFASIGLPGFSGFVGEFLVAARRVPHAAAGTRSSRRPA